ncbi:hypothetical protein Moror_10315 [Moniliophthora roreri MCA 2997]|uniref:Uncharacterized protein n=2 Tax=Moniliophthora roreri TaxID=221103 RepID=V2XGS0_MONRO|nr:hypothetical protein Moror_10315 [Moniliophthora roreri MCA 2997]KAI3609516.1 hypothetical protein WG66_001268 [Moniliophthora roreri]
MIAQEDYESRCHTLGPISAKGMGLHNCGYFIQVTNKKGCRTTGMRLTLAKDDIVFITNNQIPRAPGWLFGIKLTADSSLAEVGLVHESDVVELSVQDILRWPVVLDRPIPSSVSSIMFLGGRAGKIHFGIPARVAYRKTGTVQVGRCRCEGTREDGIDGIGRYLEADVGELVLLVGYANENYYAIKASHNSHERVWSGLLDHQDVIILRPEALDGDDAEVMDMLPKVLLQNDVRPLDDSCINGNPMASAAGGVRVEASQSQLTPTETGLTMSLHSLKRKKTSLESRILRWRSQVHEKGRSLLH